MTSLLFLFESRVFCAAACGWQECKVLIICYFFGVQTLGASVTQDEETKSYFTPLFQTGLGQPA